MSESDASTAVDILDRIESQIEEDGASLTLDDLAGAFGQRGYGPLLVVPAAIGATPVGAIPGIPSVIALVLLLFSVQMLFGRRQMWLPQMLRERQVPHDRLRTGVERLRPWAERLDRWVHGRFQSLTSPPWVKIAAVVCVVLCIAVPPLELVPFAAMLPFAAIAVIGFALLSRDGVVMLGGLSLSGAALIVMFWFLPAAL